MTDPVVLLLASATLVAAVVAVWKSRRVRAPFDVRAVFDGALRGSDIPRAVAAPLRSGWVITGSDTAASVEELLRALDREFEFQRVRFSEPVSLERGVEEVRRGLVADVSSGAQPWILVASGDGIPIVLHVLREEPVVRDRVWAFVAIGGGIRGGTNVWTPMQAEDWFGANFRSSVLDTEMHRPTLYVAVRWDAEDAGFPPCPVEDGPSWIEVVDVAGDATCDASVVASALATAVQGWCIARGG